MSAGFAGSDCCVAAGLGAEASAWHRMSCAFYAFTAAPSAAACVSLSKVAFSSLVVSSWLTLTS